MDGSVYEYHPSFVLGFHGCEQDVGEQLLSGQIGHLKPSKKEWDWLGHGIYFWEGNLARAWQWAQHRALEGKIKTPFVIGAILDLGHCLDLFDANALQQVQAAHQGITKIMATAGKQMPVNSGKTPDNAARRLDCLVMNYLHEARSDRGEPAFDAIRAPFLEGEPLYEGAGFRQFSHIQICVRTTKCIKGYFLPLSPP